MIAKWVVPSGCAEVGKKTKRRGGVRERGCPVGIQPHTPKGGGTSLFFGRVHVQRRGSSENRGAETKAPGGQKIPTPKKKKNPTKGIPGGGEGVREKNRAKSFVPLGAKKGRKKKRKVAGTDKVPIIDGGGILN